MCTCSRNIVHDTAININYYSFNGGLCSTAIGWSLYVYNSHLRMDIKMTCDPVLDLNISFFYL